LIIHGIEDAAFPEAHAYALAHEIAGARLVEVREDVEVLSVPFADPVCPPGQIGFAV
jgi:hypothetical protein